MKHPVNPARLPAGVFGRRFLPRATALSAVAAMVAQRVQAAAAAGIAPIISESHGTALRMIPIPKDPDWAKYLLLAVIWTLVIAAVIGPLHRFIQAKRLPPEIIKFRGW